MKGPLLALLTPANTEVSVCRVSSVHDSFHKLFTAHPSLSTITLHSAGFVLNAWAERLQCIFIEQIFSNDKSANDVFAKLCLPSWTGKGLPVEFKKRARCLAEVSTVWSLGSLLYWMLLGHEPYFDEDRKATKELMFEYTVKLIPKPKKKVGRFKRVLKRVGKKILAAIHVSEELRCKTKRRPKREIASLSKGERTAAIMRHRSVCHVIRD